MSSAGCDGAMQHHKLEAWVRAVIVKACAHLACDEMLI